MSETNQRVFLSHNSEDKPAVERIAESLRARGVQPWLDKWHLVPGDPWQQVIEEALRTCRACVVFVGQKLGAWQHEEMRTAIDRRVRTASTDKENQFRVIPALLPGAKRGQRSDLPSFLAATTWVEFSSVEDDAAIERLVRGLEGRSARDVAARPHGAQVECPYRGLSAFESEDADLFFGRDAVTDWLLSMLRGTQSREGERRFVALVGASGSGKSSLARAGILAALQRGEIEGSKNWPVTVLRPGAEPLLNLATSLVNTTDVTLGDGRRAKLVRELRDGLREQPDELHLTIASASDLASSSRTRRHVVLVDQFEELFTECKDADERAAFIDNLLHAGRAVGGKTIVLVTMRADFYESCAAHERLRAAIAENQFLLGPMNAGELREAIERPMQSCGGEIEPGLTELLLQDMVGQEQALPLLQHALKQLWDASEQTTVAPSRRLTVDAYRALGGIQGTLRKHADAEFSKLSGEEKSVCREVMVALVNVSDPTKETRRRVTLADLKAHSAQSEAVEAVVRRLVDARLLAASATGADGRLTNETVVEVVHEALIRGWPQLMEWIDKNRAELRARQQFHDRVKSWRHASEDRDLLYSGLLLRQVAQWAHDGSLRLSADEDAFLDASVGQFVAQLKDLKLERVPAFLEELAPLLDRARLSLQRMWWNPAPGSIEQTLASVSLLPLDGEQVYWLRDRLVACGWDEFVLVRDALLERRQEVVGWLWGELESAANSETRRFWAAVALAAFEAPSDAPSVTERWNAQAEFVARQLVEQVTYNPAMHARLVESLSPVGEVLAVPLAELAKHHGEPQRRAWATNLVAQFAADEPAKLVKLACDVEPEQYGVLFERFQAHGTAAIEAARAVLADVTTTSHDPKATPAEPRDGALKETLEKRQAHAAATLMRLEAATDAWPLWRHSVDPGVRSWLIHRVGPLGVDPRTLAARLAEEPEVSEQRALVLALGESVSVESPAGAAMIAELSERIQRLHREHPDPGLHGAAEWTLRRWNRWTPIAADESATNDPNRRWYVNGEGQTLVRIPGPVEFWMGSPTHEEGRTGGPNDKTEERHRKRVGRSFAIATHPVTVEQFLRFRADHEYQRAYSPSPRHPINWVTWYDAAAYCNWLSEQEGLPREQWCYDPEQDFEAGMSVPDDFLERTGYRLPTESEWEYACRAGTETSRHYGDSEELLGRYAWYSKVSNGKCALPTGMLKPNDLGLFDTLGNVIEWCHDCGYYYRTNKGGLSVDDHPVSERLNNGTSRVLRGGSFAGTASGVRSAGRNFFQPGARSNGAGFRPARTYN